MKWNEAIDKFLERKLNGRRIKSSYAGQLVLGKASDASRPRERARPKRLQLPVQDVPEGDREDGSTDGPGGPGEQDEDAQVLESGEAGL
jgi:hypothetical protein